MGHLGNIYTTARSPEKIEPLEPESCGLQPYYLGVLPCSGRGLLESSKRDMLLLSHSLSWQRSTTLAGNRQEEALFLWFVGMRLLLLRHPPFRLNPLGYA